MSTITIDNQEYALDDLSNQAKAELASLQTVQVSINNTKSELAILNTARKAYEAALIAKLPEQIASADQEENTLLINFKKYDLNALSDEAKSELTMRNIVDQKIANQQAELAMLKTAANTYLTSLKTFL